MFIVLDVIAHGLFVFFALTVDDGLQWSQASNRQHLSYDDCLQINVGFQTE